MGTLRFIRELVVFCPSGRQISPACGRLHQHEQLRAQLAKTQQGVAGRANDVSQGRRAWVQRRSCLRELVALELGLLRHFRIEEEEGGLLAEVRQVAPRYFDRAETLLAEHEPLARELGEIRELGQICGRSPEHWRKLELRLAAFAQKLEAHERAENEISSSVVLEDIGTSG